MAQSGHPRKISLLAQLMVVGGLSITLAITPGSAWAEPTGVSAPPDGPQAVDSDGDGIPDAPNIAGAITAARDGGVPVEDLSQRTEQVRVLINPDGSSSQEAHAAPVWFRSVDGKWRDVDYALVPRTDGGYEPNASASSLVINGGGAKEFARLVMPGGGSTVWSWPEALPEPRVSGPTATYSVSPGVDLLVTATALGVTTRIRINTPDALAPEFKVRVRTDGVELDQTDDGRLFFSDGRSRVGQSSQLVAWDGRLDQFGDPVEVVPVEADLVEVSSKGERSDQELTLETPEELASDPELVYPITIDPDIAPLTASQDTWVRKNTTTIDKLTYRIMVGRIGSSSNTNPAYGYVQWPNGEIAGRTISRAEVHLYEYAAGSCDPRRMNIHPLVGKWDETKVTYATKPAGPTDTGTSSYLTESKGGDGCAPNGFVSADLTKMVQAWAKGAKAGGLDNHGVQMNVPKGNNSDVSFERRFCSTNVDPSHTSCYQPGRTPYMTITLPAVPLAMPGRPAEPTLVVSDEAPVLTPEEALPDEPTPDPTEQPSADPSEVPDPDPTVEPTEVPSSDPTEGSGEDSTEVDDSLTIAPEAFAVDGNTVYLADPVNSTVRKYVAGQYQASIELPQAVNDLQVSGSTLSVLDSESNLSRYTISATDQAALSSTKLLINNPDIPEDSTDLTLFDDSVDRVDAFDNVLVARANSGTDLPTGLNISAIGPGTMPVMEEFETLANGFHVLNKDGRILKTVTVPYDPQSIEAIYRGGGYDYYLVSDAYNTENGEAKFNSYVYRFKVTGAPAGVYTLALTEDTPPNRSVTVVGDQLYQLIVEDGAARVLRLGPDTGDFVNAADLGTIKDLDLMEAATGASESGDISPYGLPPKRGKYRVLSDAIALSRVKWTCRKSTNGNKSRTDNPRAVSQPYQLQKAKDGERMTGIPYAWGGYDSKTTHSHRAKWSDFRDGISRGMYAGNVRNAGTGYIGGTVGIDCSGLVSVAFRLGGKWGTWGLFEDRVKFKTIKGHTPHIGDILVKRGKHVQIVNAVLSKGRYMVVEATTAGNYDKVVVRSRNAKDFASNKGYLVRRYRNLDLYS